MNKYVPSGYIILNIGKVTMVSDEVEITDKELQEKIDYALQSKKPVLLTIEDTASEESASGFCVNNGGLILTVYCTLNECLQFAVNKVGTTYKATRVYQESE